jgi:hypothetical protein
MQKETWGFHLPKNGFPYDHPKVWTINVCWQLGFSGLNTGGDTWMHSSKGEVSFGARGCRICPLTDGDSC